MTSTRLTLAEVLSALALGLLSFALVVALVCAPRFHAAYLSYLQHGQLPDLHQLIVFNNPLLVFAEVVGLGVFFVSLDRSVSVSEFPIGLRKRGERPLHGGRARWGASKGALWLTTNLLAFRRRTWRPYGREAGRWSRAELERVEFEPLLFPPGRVRCTLRLTSWQSPSFLLPRSEVEAWREALEQAGIPCERGEVPRQRAAEAVS